MATQLRTFLWFNKDLENALEFYQNTFGDVQIRNKTIANGELFVAEFSIYGYDLIAMNVQGGPQFNDSISLSLHVENQEEVDRLWAAITTEGEEGRCGWCKDKWGLSWQITPQEMHKWLANPDPEIRNYANKALMGMNKIVLDDLHF
ncbi:MAG: VOC family protein [Micrococcales bacterium]